MRFIREKAITSYYRSIIKDAVEEAIGSDLSGKRQQELNRYGITVISKVVNIDKNFLQINFYLFNLDRVNPKYAAREFGYECISDLEHLSSAEAFFNTKTNYIACRVLLDDDMDPVDSSSDITSTVLHELTHYLDHRVAGDYHDKNKVKPLDTDGLISLPVVDEFNYLLYAVWTPTERNAFQTSDDSYWSKLKLQVNSVVNLLSDMANNSEDDSLDTLFEYLRKTFVAKTDKACPKSPKTFIQWWCRKTSQFFADMDKKRSKDNYLAKSVDNQVESLSDLLFNNLKPMLGKYSAKIEVPFQFYSTKKRSTIDEVIKLSIVGFMDEIEDSSVTLMKIGTKLSYRDVPSIGKIYDALYHSDVQLLKKQCLALSSSINKLVSNKA